MQYFWPRPVKKALDKPTRKTPLCLQHLSLIEKSFRQVIYDRPSPRGLSFPATHFVRVWALLETPPLPSETDSLHCSAYIKSSNEEYSKCAQKLWLFHCCDKTWWYLHPRRLNHVPIILIDNPINIVVETLSSFHFQAFLATNLINAAIHITNSSDIGI